MTRRLIAYALRQQDSPMHSGKCKRALDLFTRFPVSGPASSVRRGERSAALAAHTTSISLGRPTQQPLKGALGMPGARGGGRKRGCTASWGWDCGQSPAVLLGHQHSHEVAAHLSRCHV
jgi:hypothetical protein